MAPPLDLKFDRALADRVHHVAGLGLQAQRYAAQAVVNIGRAAAKKAAELTPRSGHSDAFLSGVAPPDGHIADKWTTEERAVGQDVFVKVHNTHPRATRKVELADGSVQDYTLLDILEYGSRAHVIEPVNGPFLIFYWGKIGRTVHAKRVRHPGTRPYSMMGLARNQALIDLKRAADALRTVVRLAMSGKTAASALVSADLGG